MNWQKLAITVAAVPAALLTVAASTPPPATTPTPTPTSVVDPICAFTTGCVSPSPTSSAGVLSAGTGVATPATGDSTGLLAGLASLPVVAIGIAAIRWARRRK